jgi:hypothetical protein
LSALDAPFFSQAIALFFSDRSGVSLLRFKSHYPLGKQLHKLAIHRMTNALAPHFLQALGIGEY